MEITGTTYRPNTTGINKSAKSIVAKYISINPLGIGFLLSGEGRRNNSNNKGGSYKNTPFMNETINIGYLPSDLVSRWD